MRILSFLSLFWLEIRDVAGCNRFLCQLEDIVILDKVSGVQGLTVVGWMLSYCRGIDNQVGLWVTYL